MSYGQELSQELLRQLIWYDEKTGRCFWKERDISMFNPSSKYSVERVAKTWNTRCSGTEIKSKCSKGYLLTKIFGRTEIVHRIIWLYCYGVWPEQIDHINGDASDNRLSNLRNVTNRTNCKNRSLRADNKSGVTGVYWNKKINRWVAQIKLPDRNLHLGCFTSLNEAIECRTMASKAHNFHENHGRTKIGKRSSNRKNNAS